MLIEPFTIGVHALMRANVQIGDTIVVQGSGAIGLMTLICAKISGAAKLIIVGGPSERLELARRINEFPFAEMVSHVLPLSCVREGFEALSGSHKLAGETVIKIAIGANAE